MIMYKYYEIRADWELPNTMEAQSYGPGSKGLLLFGSYDKEDCAAELVECIDDWEEEGYRNIRVVSNRVEQAPDPTVYPELSY